MDTPNKSDTTEENLQRIVTFLTASIPTFNDLLEVLEKNNGWLPLKSEAIDLLSKLDPPWCTLYENKNYLKELSYQISFTGEEVNEESLNNFIEDVTDEYKKASNQKNDVSAKEHQKSQQVDIQSIYLAGFFNTLALMIHRRSMCQLITDAKNGDDEAFCLAVQIDRTVLQLSYFQQRLLKSQFSDDAKFLDKLASRIRTPILQSKIRYRTLIFIFATLDDMNILDSLTHEKLLNICMDIGVTGGENGIDDDVGKLRKRLYEYKKISRM